MRQGPATSSHHSRSSSCGQSHRSHGFYCGFLALVCLLLTASCTWVNDDTDDCPEGFWLNLHYTYNILDVEAAPEYVRDVSVFVYDTVGNYVTRIDAPQTLLKAFGHRVRIQGIPEGDYQFVVWSGIGNSEYTVSGNMLPLDQFRLSLASAAPAPPDSVPAAPDTIPAASRATVPAASAAAPLPDLFFGSLPPVHFDNAYAVHDVFLMKNTNQLACLIVPLDDSEEMQPDDYTMKVVTANGTMDARNRLVSPQEITYGPYVKDTVTVDDVDYGLLHGIKFGISTLRLMEDTDCRLILEKTETGETVFNISLPEYIGMIGSLYTALGRPLSVQEYLDRQDFYTIVFFLSGANLDQLLQLQVNSWRLRAYHHLKL